MPMKKLKPSRYITEEEATKDLRQQFIVHPRLQSRVRLSARSAAGSTSLGWYRGHHAGIYDAYLTLKDTYPEAAGALIAAYGMDDEGDITLT